MHFDLIDLRLYLNILDAGNITAGAARSHLSLAAAICHWLRPARGSVPWKPLSARRSSCAADVASAPPRPARRWPSMRG